MFRVKVGINDLLSCYPLIAAQWDYEKNGNLKPSDVPFGSHEKVWWVCEKGHSSLCSVKHKAISAVKCPVCSNRIIVSGINDLFSLFPEVVLYWNCEKNVLKPDEVGAGSHKKVWWVCEKGHEWEAKIVSVVKGSRCPYCAGVKVSLDTSILGLPELMVEWSSKNIVLPSEVSKGSNQKVWWVCEKGHEWEAYVYDRTSGHGCKVCKRSYSQPEEDLYLFFKKIFSTSDIVRNFHMGSFELDFFFPEINMAVEFNGLYWHSETAGKDKNYHYGKWLACKEQGIQLIQIWEDDWNRNPDLVKSMLAQKLGISNDPKIYGRNTVAKNINKEKAEVFLRKNHIQGFASGSYYLGLFNKRDIEKLVAVLVLKKEAGTGGKTLNIIRYATFCNVPGGFTKLLRYAEKMYAPEKFVTFSDNTVSDGGLYKNNGFIADKELKPDYMYIVRKERSHKFNYRLKRFKIDPDLKYVDSFTESELAALNGLLRIWDAGKTRWVKILK